MLIECSERLSRTGSASSTSNFIWVCATTLARTSWKRRLLCVWLARVSEAGVAHYSPGASSAGEMRYRPIRDEVRLNTPRRHLRPTPGQRMQTTCACSTSVLTAAVAQPAVTGCGHQLLDHHTSMPDLINNDHQTRRSFWKGLLVSSSRPAMPASRRTPRSCLFTIPRSRRIDVLTHAIASEISIIMLFGFAEIGLPSTRCMEWDSIVVIAASRMSIASELVISKEI